MIELLLVALLQATEPQTAPATTAPTETVTESPAPTVAPETSENVQVVGEEQSAVQCERRVQAGSRLRQRRVTCTTADTRDAAAETAREISRSGGAAGQSGELGRGN